MSSILFCSNVNKNSVISLNNFFRDINNLNTKVTEMEFQFDNYGGDPFYGIQLYQVMKSYIKKTNTKIIVNNVSACHSASIYPFLAAPLDDRIAIKGATFLFHETTITTQTNVFTEAQFRKQGAASKQLNDNCAEILQLELKWNRTDINELWNRNEHMSAEEALERKLISKIIDRSSRNLFDIIINDFS